MQAGGWRTAEMVSRYTGRLDAPEWSGEAGKCCRTEGDRLLSAGLIAAGATCAQTTLSFTTPRSHGDSASEFWVLPHLRAVAALRCLRTRARRVLNPARPDMVRFSISAG